MRRKVTHQAVGGTHTVCKTCPACSYSIPVMGADKEKPSLNAQTQRDSQSSISRGRVWCGQEKGPCLAFALPTSTRFTRFVQHPTDTGPWRGSWSWATVGVSTRMGLTGRAKSLSSNCCFGSLLIWICKFLQHQQR